MRNALLPSVEESSDVLSRTNKSTVDISRRELLLRGSRFLLLGVVGCAQPTPDASEQGAERRETVDFDPLRDVLETNEKFLDLPVPFVCQAPSGNWKPPFDEACEETCLFMLREFIADHRNIDPLRAEAEIRDIANFVASKGHGIDIGVKTVGEIAAERYPLRAKVYEKDMVTPQNIQRLLATGHPVVLPVAQFKNKHFKSEAPYHMIVVKGFDSSDKEPTFITNDPGTRHGDGYAYPESYLMEHIHEWNGSRDTVSKAPKAMLVLGKL